MAQERHGTAFIVGATLGGIAGAVWGLLNARETGAQARSGLVQKFDAGADWLIVAAADLEVTARTMLAGNERASPNSAAAESGGADDHTVWDPATVEVSHEEREVLPTIEGAGGPDEVIG